MHHGQRRAARNRGPFRKRLSELEDELEEANLRVVRLENTFKGVIRETDDVSIAGPCRCGESYLIVRFHTIYCPCCGYRRTL